MRYPVTPRRTVEELSRIRRLQRAAERQGATLHMSRRRDVHARDFDRYWIVTADGTLVGIEDGKWAALTLDQVEELLGGRLRNRARTGAA